MDPKALKYGEIFAFLAFIFLIVILVAREELNQTQQVAARVPGLETELAQQQETAALVPGLQQELQEARRGARSDRRADRRATSALQARIAQLEARLSEVDRLQSELAAARAAVAEAERPPIVVLSETNSRYEFEVGSAVIPDDFEQALVEEIVPRLERYSEECGCDAIEVVGHTDGLPVEGRSNLDRELVAAFNRAELPQLVPGSNLDLGMLRALSVVRALRAAQRDGALANIRYFLPYSAGQMLRPDRTLELDSGSIQDKGRRRIELRLLDSNAWADGSSEAP